MFSVRFLQHNAEWLYLEDKDVEAVLEKETHSRGFYIGKVGYGGNCTNSFSIYVYTYLREWYTIEYCALV